MSDKNSIWPNGMGVDENGYAVFYPMGTNKVEIPSNSPHWPKGNKLIGQFVYKDDKLVGFCDTKAMISENSGEIVVMPYEYIDTEFDSIEKDSIQIHAPKATYKKASWTDGEKEDIPDVEYKYKGCIDINNIKNVDANYLENDIVDGKWTELLSDMTSASNMFDGCTSLTHFNSDLSSLKNGFCVFYNCTNLKSFEGDLSSLGAATNMFTNCSSLSKFTSDLSSMTYATHIFQGCSSLTTFDLDLSSLTYGAGMFRNCTNLAKFSSDLSSLTNGSLMFFNCSNLQNFDVILSSIVDGNQMFWGCNKLTTFVSDLSSLTNGDSMFRDCVNLTNFNRDYNGSIINLSSLTTATNMFANCNLSSFKSDLSSLAYGASMFQGCSNLTTFNSDLSSLTSAGGMFAYCKLDVPSVKNIIDTINTVETANLTLGVGCNNNNEDKDLFAQEVGYTDMTTLLQTLQDKGWTVTAQYNGRPTSNYSLRQPESLPVYVKLIEVIPTEEDDYTHYEYTSQDGSKFYNLDWFHETTGTTDGYTQFSSLEESISSWNIVPKE